MVQKKYVIAKPFGAKTFLFFKESKLLGHLIQSSIGVNTAEKYTFAQVAALKEKHERQWHNSNLKVFEVVLTLGKEVELP